MIGTTMATHMYNWSNGKAPPPDNIAKQLFFNPNSIIICYLYINRVFMKKILITLSAAEQMSHYFYDIQRPVE